MKLRAQTVVIPCISFPAKVRLVARSGTLTPIEFLGLRAIGHGIDDVDSLSQVIGLGTRPTLDLIYDFWLKGYIVVDTTQGRVRLARNVAVAAESGRLAELETAENSIEKVSLVQELVSGSILPLAGGHSIEGPPSSFVPTERSGLVLDGVTRVELLDAVQREVQHQSKQRERDLVVQEAWVEPHHLISSLEAAPLDRRYLALLADVQLDPDSGRLLFDIIDAPDLTPSVRRSVARGLSLLAERLPRHLFFKRLRQELERSPTAAEPDGPRENALARLKRAVSALDATDTGVLASRHEQLVEHYDDACEEVRASASSEAKARLVAGYETQEIEIRRLITSAERQLVLGNPWVTFDALLDPSPTMQESWFDLIQSALARGVSIFLLWGISPDSKLDGRVRSALLDLSAKYPGRLVHSPKSSALHAKLVVRDAHEALITSFNYLNPPRTRNSFELGVLVTGSAPNEAPAAVLDLLEWCRDRFPEYQAAQRMLLLPTDLGAFEPAPPKLPTTPEPPDRGSLGAAGGVSSAAILHWAQSWRAVAEQLRHARSTYRHAAELVIDREHREALWRALRESRARLAVLSDRLSVDVVTDRFIRALRTRLDEGVSSVFLFRREGASDRDDGPASRLREEAQRVPSLCHLVEAPSHAKVLVSDDEVLIGSFNFLSYGGDYGSGSRERSELSIRVRNAETTEEALAILGAKWPGSFTLLVDRKPPLAENPTPLPPVPRLQPLFQVIQDPNGDGEEVLRWFENVEEPWRDVEGLEMAGISPDALYRAAAAALAGAASVDDDRVLAWRSRFALWRWQELDFVGSALLVPDARHGEGGLSPWLARLGAFVAGAGALEIALPSSLSEVSIAEATSAASLLVVAILLYGGGGLLETLERLAPQLVQPAAAWPAAVRRFHEQVFQPLPMALLRRMADGEQHKVETATAKTAFADDLATAESVGFKFQVGEHTWQRLKQPGQLLGELRLAHDTNDPIRLERYLAEHGDPEYHMDQASRVVGDHRADQIVGSKRIVCLKRLRRAIKAAHTWVALAQHHAPSASEAKALEACGPLRQALDRFRCESLEDDPLVGPALRFSRERLAPLFGAEAS